MVFVDGLCVVHTAIDTRNVILCYSHNSLNSEEDICNESKNAMWGGEVGAGVSEFIVFNDYESGKEG